MTLSCLERPGVKLTVLIKNLEPITRHHHQLLKNVTKPQRRVELVANKEHMDICQEDSVLYFSPKDPFHSVPAIVRYIGRVSEMSRDGFLLGLEITEAGWRQGGSGRGYFDCEAGKAAFCDIGCVTPVRANARTIDTRETNNNVNKPVLSLVLSEKKNNLEHHNPWKQPQQTSNSLRMIHNDLKEMYLPKVSLSL